MDAVADRPLDRPVDRPLSDGEFSAAVVAVTSAFGDPTRRAIYLAARDSERGMTAAEVAEMFDLHPNVARHHLDKLAAGGHLEVHIERSGGGAGRPSKRYRASARAVTVDFPARQADLLVTLLGRALALLAPDQAEAMAEQVGEEYGRALAEQMAPSLAGSGGGGAAGGASPAGDGTRSVRSALHAVADALTAHGFAAHAEDRPGAIAIINEQCPFGVTASQHPVICAVDRGMVRGMLAGLYGDTAPATESSRARGDDSCVTLV